MNTKLTRSLIMLMAFLSLTTVSFAQGRRHRRQVPEPATIALLGAGLLTLTIFSRRTKNKK